MPEEKKFIPTDELVLVTQVYIHPSEVLEETIAVGESLKVLLVKHNP